MGRAANRKATSTTARRPPRQRQPLTTIDTPPESVAVRVNVIGTQLLNHQHERERVLSAQISNGDEDGDPMPADRGRWIADPDGQYIEPETGKRYVSYAQRRAQHNKSRQRLYEANADIRDQLDKFLEEADKRQQAEMGI